MGLESPENRAEPPGARDHHPARARPCTLMTDDQIRAVKEFLLHA
jgi:hypothetical protein